MPQASQTPQDEWARAAGGGNTPAWDYSVEPVIVGYYVQKKTDVGPNRSNLYILETAPDVQIGVWGGTVMDNQMSSVAPGQKIRITYQGLKTNDKTGRQYKDFVVDVSKTAPLKSVWPS